jgi:uroporphyrinogen decarboxylase
MYFNVNQWVESVINSENKPILPVLTYPGLQILGKTMNNMTNSADIHFQCIKTIAERYPSMAAVLLSMDLSIEAEAFGTPIKYSDDEVPSVSDRLIFDYAEIKDLEIPEPDSRRIEEYIKAVELASEANFDKPVFAGTIGPFSLAGRLLDITEIMTGILIDPDNMHILLEKCTSFLLNYLKDLKNAGANGVLMAEPASGLLGEEQCDEFSSRYVEMIVDEIQDDKFLVILHNCGQVESLVNSMVSTGAKGFHFGNAVDMMNILPQVPSDRLVFGNLDPVDLIKNGTPETIASATKELKEKTKAYKNFVLSTGCDIPIATPLENIDALFSV